MGFYTVLFRVNKVITARGWRLRHCRRCDCGVLRYYVTDGDGVVISPGSSSRIGLTLAQLLQWLANQQDAELVAFAGAQPYDAELAA